MLSNHRLELDAGALRLLAAVERLDMEPIKWKLVADPDGPQWDRHQAEHTESEYRRFLTLCALYPDKPIVPSKLVDKFWHAHILDTIKYAEDCQAALGYFLHHFPYFGARGVDDRAALNLAYCDTQALLEKHFGVSSELAPALCGPENCDPSVIGERPRLDPIGSAPALCGPANCDPSVIGGRPRLIAA